MKRWYRNLSEFIRHLDQAGELKIVEKAVSSHLEISRLTDRESKSPGGGKALFFKDVQGSPFPVATNLFGSDRRICMALGVGDLDQLGERLRGLIEMRPPQGLGEALTLLPTALSVTRFFPKRSRAKVPPCQEVVHRGDQVDLRRLPALHHWPKDAGPFITLPLVFTRSLDSGQGNMGMYRLQVFDRNTTGMHWHIHKDGSHFFQEYRRAGKRMPVAVAIGADPATIYAATAPMPRNVEETILAGFIRGRPVPMARCLTVDLRVPAEAEFVLEGYVDPEELRTEGPFGDHTGYYSPADAYPVFHVTALTHRKNPIYCSTLVGPPPMEDCYLGKATERLFLPLIRTVLPEIQDYWFPWEGAFHNIVVVSMDKEYPGHAQKLMNGLWGQGQMSFCKAVVVVDREVNPRDPVEVLEKLLSTLELGSDLSLVRGILDVLDHSSSTPNFGSKIGLDLTDRVAGEPPRMAAEKGHFGPFPDEAALLSTLRNKLEDIVGLRIMPPHPPDSKSVGGRHAVLALNARKGSERGGRSFADLLLEDEDLKGFSILILFDPAVPLEDHARVLWKLFHNTDPGRDLYFRDGRVLVDACVKGAMDGYMREWPEELVFDDVT